MKVLRYLPFIQGQTGETAESSQMAKVISSRLVTVLATRVASRLTITLVRFSTMAH